MPAPSHPPLNRDRAWACLILNLSFPGWGSWKAGRKLAGIGEMLIVFAGLLLMGDWFIQWMNRIIQSELDEALPPVPSARLWRWGVGLIAVSCVWTVVTCISILQQARAHEKEMSQNAPPKLADLPKPPKLN